VAEGAQVDGSLDKLPGPCKEAQRKRYRVLQRCVKQARVGRSVAWQRQAGGGKAAAARGSLTDMYSPTTLMEVMAAKAV